MLLTNPSDIKVREMEQESSDNGLLFEKQSLEKEKEKLESKLTDKSSKIKKLEERLKQVEEDRLNQVSFSDYIR